MSVADRRKAVILSAVSLFISVSGLVLMYGVDVVEETGRSLGLWVWMIVGAVGIVVGCGWALVDRRLRSESSKKGSA